MSRLLGDEKRERVSFRARAVEPSAAEVLVSLNVVCNTAGVTGSSKAKRRRRKRSPRMLSQLEQRFGFTTAILDDRGKQHMQTYHLLRLNTTHSISSVELDGSQLVPSDSPTSSTVSSYLRTEMRRCVLYIYAHSPPSSLPSSHSTELQSLSSSAPPRHRPPIFLPQFSPVRQP